MTETERQILLEIADPANREKRWPYALETPNSLMARAILDLEARLVALEQRQHEPEAK